MKRWIATLLVTGFCVGAVVTHAQTKAQDAKTPPASSGSATEELKRIENAWVAAVKAKDSAKLDGIRRRLGRTRVGWQITDKPTNLAELKSPGNSLASFEMGLMTFALCSTVVVTGATLRRAPRTARIPGQIYLD